MSEDAVKITREQAERILECYRAYFYRDSYDPLESKLDALRMMGFNIPEQKEEEDENARDG